jgi:hypothetical protein
MMESFKALLNKIPATLYRLEPDNDIARLFKLFSEEFDELKAAIDELSILKDIERQKGAVLDEIGRIVRESRKGRNDEDYRVFLKIAIKRNTSTGSLKAVAELTKSIAKDLDYNIREHLFDGGTVYLGGTRFFDGEILLNPNADAAEPAAFEVEIEGDINALKVPDHLTEVINDIRSAGVKAAVKPFWKATTSTLLKHSCYFSLNFNSGTMAAYSFLDGQSFFDGTVLMNGVTGARLTHTIEFEERNN